VGYTAHYVAGVWIGNDDNTPMRKVTGGTLPAELWHDIMLSAHEDKTPMALPGTRGPVLYDAIARLPWNEPQAKRSASGQSLFRRVFGFFGG
jgi:penicillin-binding protein 1A